MKSAMSMRPQQLVKQTMASCLQNVVFTVPSTSGLIVAKSKWQKKLQGSMFGEVLETLLTSWNSFNLHFVILFKLHCTWPTIPKACANLTNSS